MTDGSENGGGSEQLGTLDICIPSRRLPEDVTDDDYTDIGVWDARSRVFYDEDIPVYLRLRAEDADEINLETVAEFVTIGIDVKVYGLVATQHAPEAARRERTHIIFSRVLSKECLIHCSQENGAIWFVHVPVRHPRSRLLHPKLVIDAVANLGKLYNKRESVDQPVKPTRQLAELEPIEGVNFFDALSYDEPHYQHGGAVVDRRTSRDVTPNDARSDRRGEAVKLADAELQIPVYPALNLRLRCAKLTGGGERDNLIASIEITCGETAKVNVLIKHVSLELIDGSVTALGPVQLPHWLCPGESLAVSYSISGIEVPLTSATAGSVAGHVGPVTIYAECSPSDGNESHPSPLVKTKWDTTVDFDVTPNPQSPMALPSPVLSNGSGFDAIPLRRIGRPLNRTTSNNSLPTAVRPRPPLTGLTLSFTGPSTAKIGDTFEWKVFVVNRSSIARNLSLYFQGREGANSDRKSSLKTVEGYSMVDRATLKRMAMARSFGNRGIVSLMNDVRIGPLQPQACFETEITLLALSPGIHTLSDVTLVDLGNGDGYDCGRLLEVVVNQ
jgi:hypothetical protein